MTDQPHFLIVGAARSGTTALTKMLEQHPQVFMTSPKEVHFFAHANAPKTYTGPGDDLMLNNHLITDPEIYSRLYSTAPRGAICGEGSVSTMMYPEHAIPAIRAWANPNVKIIMMLREPAARAYSSYLYLRARGHEDAETFDEGLRQEPARIAAGYHHMWQYRAVSRYAQQLPQFADAFDDNNLFVGIFEEYREGPQEYLSQICDFIGADSTFQFATDGNVNRGGVPKNKALTAAMNMLRHNQRVLDVVKKAVPTPATQWLMNANLERPEPDPELLERLRGEFATDREAVEAHLQREIPAWRKA